MIDATTAYARWAQTYDSCENATRDLDASVLRAHGPRCAGLDVVELGCGTGKNSAWLAAESRSLTALDFSAEMMAIARARVRANHVRFVQADLRRPWPLPNAAADVIVANLVLEHIRDLTPVFAEAARVVRPGGELYLAELHPFRQLLGSGARIAGAGDARIEAYVHDMSDYVNGALAAGLRLRRLGEWRDPGADASAPPRLVSLHAEAPR